MEALGLKYEYWLIISLSVVILTLLLFITSKLTKKINLKIPSLVMGGISLIIAILALLSKVLPPKQDNAGTTVTPEITCAIDTQGDGNYISTPDFTNFLGDDSFRYDGCIKTEERGDRLWAKRTDAGDWGYCNQGCPTAKYKFANDIKNEAFSDTWSFAVSQFSQFYKYDQPSGATPAEEYYSEGIVNQGNVAIADVEDILPSGGFVNDETDDLALGVCKELCSLEPTCNSFRTLSGRCYFNKTTVDDNYSGNSSFNSYWKLEPF